MKTRLSPQEKKSFLIPAALLAAFLLFTLLVRFVDVRAIGPESSKVGWAAVNGALLKLLPFRAGWYKLAEFLGMLGFVVIAFFAVTGLLQLLRGRNLAAVDPQLLLLGCFYVLVLILYVLFNKVAINCRPVILDAAEGLEPSYPSSHTLLAVCVMCTAVMLTEKYLKLDERIVGIVNLVLLFLAVLTVLSRLLSGVHWFTDILGSLLLSAGLVGLFEALLPFSARLALPDVPLNFLPQPQPDAEDANEDVEEPEERIAPLFEASEEELLPVEEAELSEEPIPSEEELPPVEDEPAADEPEAPAAEAEDAPAAEAAAAPEEEISVTEEAVPEEDISGSEEASPEDTVPAEEAPAPEADALPATPVSDAEPPVEAAPEEDVKVYTRSSRHAKPGKAAPVRKAEPVEEVPRARHSAAGSHVSAQSSSRLFSLPKKAEKKKGRHQA